jgi:hypothetical protein
MKSFLYLLLNEVRLKKHKTKYRIKLKNPLQHKSQSGFLKYIIKINYLRLTTFSQALTIALAFKPYLSINCSGVPDSPKVSLVATNS